MRKNYINKLLIILCLASVAVNIWLVGFVLGNKADEFRHEHGGKSGRFERRVQMLIRDLPPPAQNQFMDTMRDYIPDDEDKFRNKLEGLNHKLAESIRGDNVDVEAAQEALSGIRSTMGQTHAKFHQGFLKAIQGLSPEQRKVVAKALEEKKY